jgi:antitoxin component of MazEF toxin-antitoxin module
MANTHHLYAGNHVKFRYPVYPLSFFHWYETSEYNQMEFSNKILAPDKLLITINNYSNISMPYFFQFPNTVGIFSIGKFIEELDGIYVPERLFQQLQIELGTEIDFELINQPLQQGTKITIRPKTSELLEIDDPKQFLQDKLQFNYTALEESEVIVLNISNNNKLYITISKTEPSFRINITETDLEIDFEEPENYQEYLLIKQLQKESEENEKRLEQEKKLIEENKNQLSEGFKINKLNFKLPKQSSQQISPSQSFTGTGNRLGTK